MWATSNPGSPLNLYKDGSTVRSRVTSISFFSRANGITDIAQVRYIKGRRNGDGGEEQLTHWVATIQYAYVEPSKNAQSRQINPLGFRIVDFKSEQETLPDGPSTLQTAAAAAHGHTP
jgi:type IV secretion system protein VirB8